METFAAIVEHARREVELEHVIIGGHSMGGRTASILAAEGFACDGLLLLDYPLCHAGQPDKLRDAHLAQIRVTILCWIGTRDELCRKELMEKVAARPSSGFTMRWLEGADHGYHVQKSSGRTDDDVMNEVGDVTKAWAAGIAAPTAG